MPVYVLNVCNASSVWQNFKKSLASSILSPAFAFTKKQHVDEVDSTVSPAAEPSVLGTGMYAKRRVPYAH